jgi:hypothetical protein
VAQATVDDDGNFCATSTSSTAPVAGSAAAATVGARTITGSITSFDAATERYQEALPPHLRSRLDRCHRRSSANLIRWMADQILKNVPAGENTAAWHY